MAHSVSLSWAASLGPVDGYNVYKGPTAGAESTLLNSSLITGTTYVDNTATPGVEYYAVKASLNGIETDLSGDVQAVVMPAPATNLALVSVS